MNIRRYTRKAITPILSLLALCAPTILFAQIQNPIIYGTPQALIYGIVDVLTYITVIVFPLVLAFMGMSAINASRKGDIKTLETLRTAFFYACIGAGVVLASKAIVAVLQATFNQINNP